ncbi:MAG: SDR family oxidoreductase [Alistipes sp.]|jgi:NAD(P)-dependent dehydrogenase (short-subunit alcohol dehydrogenase family)|nr:SDR family oxidoreductase [Alistipes sp.]
MKDFRDKVVIITGASSGIGEALAYEFAALGARVVVSARNFERLTEVAERVGRISASVSRLSGPSRPPQSLRGPRTPSALAVACDVSREEDCVALVDKTVAAFGAIDVLVCNAGVSMRALLDDVDVGVLHRLMDVNFWGTVYCTKYALPWLLRSRGSVVGVSSVAGLHGLPGRTGYSASKYAMTGFLETVRVENLHRGLHVMIACPGFTATNVRLSALTADGTPQGATPREESKMMSAGEVAYRIIGGISRRRRLLLMEFEGRATHWIKKFAPSLLDKLFYKAMAREPDSPLK